MNIIAQTEFVLASASPRRKELLAQLGIAFEVITSNVEETSVQAQSVEQYVQEVARLKTRDVAAQCGKKTVIGADTIVVFQDRLLHKPKNRAEAITHLQALSGNAHRVLTAVVIIQPDGEETVFVEETVVKFKQLSFELIEAYVDSGDPFDKAGGYGIQTHGALFVERIEGDYNNVVGFPLASLFEQLIHLRLLTF
ncbi:Maf family protein [Lysinibacillus louembei]|uniref:dTTP/UTP pyrophosphatase n=1 Tax=Lysinibacillus louembei TaxID=1470088 RepID=A0ABZ0RRE7_9BACI|nr:Maf family protein [Lysinibacillus louembei]WPK10798.1 Maf family protein [Lysinibacillus louembei]